MAVDTKQNILDLNDQDLSDYLIKSGEKAFRAKQIFEWIYHKGIFDFDAMSNLSRGLREALGEKFKIDLPHIAETRTARDRTVKYLLTLGDGEQIESVLIPAAGRLTQCVSTQVGCRHACRFCASGVGGFKRNLSVGEISGQIMAAKAQKGEKAITHIVLMGVGEPLDNYDNTMKAVRLMNAPYALGIAARRITISTCGLVPEIKRLSREGLQLELSVSLHGSNDTLRNRLMPINRQYPLKELMAACRQYVQATHRQITFEYLLIRDLTCTRQCAEELSLLLKGLLCKVNLIPYNEVDEFSYESVTKLEMLTFEQCLLDKKILATVRMPRGRDIAAACGQLRLMSARKSVTA